MGWLSAIGSALKLAWAVVSGRNAQADRVNTPEMQANAKAKTDAAVADKATADVKAALEGGGLTQLQKDAAE